jgi:hypothetical protein
VELIEAGPDAALYGPFWAGNGMGHVSRRRGGGL